MPACIARYRCRLRSGSFYDGGIVVVRFVEERESDDLGDPGRLLSRRVEAVEAPCGPSWMERLTNQPKRWRLSVGEQIGPIEWME